MTYQFNIYIKALILLLLVSCSSEEPNLTPITDKTDKEQLPELVPPPEGTPPQLEDVDKVFHLVKIDALGINSCEEYSSQVSEDVEAGSCPEKLDIPSTFGSIVPTLVAGCQYQDVTVWYYESTPLGEAGTSEDLEIDPEIVKKACEQGSGEENQKLGTFMQTDYNGPGFIRGQ